MEEAVKFEDKGVYYSIKDKNYLKNKKICIFGGGDSALDWAIELSKFAQVILVHRRNEFRGAENSIRTVKKREKEGKLKIKTTEIPTQELPRIGGVVKADTKGVMTDMIKVFLHELKIGNNF